MAPQYSCTESGQITEPPHDYGSYYNLKEDTFSYNAKRKNNLNRLHICMLLEEKTTRDTKPGCYMCGIVYRLQSTERALFASTRMICFSNSPMLL